MKSLFFALLFLVAVPSGLRASEPPIRFHSLKAGIELPRRTVLCVAQDAYGYVWLGTPGGLCKYDGYGIEMPGMRGQHQGLSNSIVRELAVDSKGNIWAATDYGLNCFDRRTEEFSAFFERDGLAGNTVSHVMIDRQGWLWAIADNGLRAFDITKGFRRLPQEQYNLPTEATAFCQGHGDWIWIASGELIYGYNKASRKLSRLGDYSAIRPVSGSISVLKSLNTDTLLVGTRFQGMFLFVISKARFERLPLQCGITPEADAAFVTDILAASDGTIWVTSYNIPLLRIHRGFRGSSFFRNDIYKQNIPPTKVLHCLYEDANGEVWIGTERYGAFLAGSRSNGFHTYSCINAHDKGLSDNVVTSLLQDHRQRIWVGTQDGMLNLFDHRIGCFRVLNKDPDFERANWGAILTLYEYPEGVIWIGHSHGLDRYEERTGSLLLSADYAPEPFSYVQCMVRYGDEELLVGTNRGLFVLHTRHFVQKKIAGQPQSSLSHLNVRAVLVLPDSTVLLGTETGLDLWEPGSGVITSFVPPCNLKVNRLLSLDARYVLVATEGMGGYVFDVESRQLIPVDLPQLSRGVSLWGAVLSSDSVLWLATGSGLLSYSVPQRHLRTYPSLTAFSESAMSRNAMLSTVSGHIVRGGADGLQVFHPDSLVLLSYVPHARITGIRLFEQTVKPGQRVNGRVVLPVSVLYMDTLYLNYDDNVVSIDYGVIFPPRDAGVQYAYRLEPFHNQWVVSDRGAHSAVFTNLRGGKYCFRVKARVGESWGPESRLYVVVWPHFSNTWWFRVLMLLLVAALLFALYKLRVRQYRRYAQSLERKVSERTREIDLHRAEMEAQRDNLQQQVEFSNQQSEKIVRQNARITESILYAQQIQNAVLPRKTLLGQVFQEHFLIYKPRDIVSGDFYWISEKDKYVFLAVGDCTGHGVPGAFMSVLGISLLRESINKSPDLSMSPNIILNSLRKEVKSALGQQLTQGGPTDGIDLGLCVIDLEHFVLRYAGANISLLIGRDNQVDELYGDRMPVGLHINRETPFTLHQIDMREGDVYYLSTDGFYDQLGGAQNRRFMKRRLKDVIAGHLHLSLREQRQVYTDIFHDWKGANPQVDDVLFLGFKIKLDKLYQHSQNLYNWRGRTILVVDDEELNYHYLLGILEPTGVNTLWVSSGQEAIEMCRQRNEIQIVLMDIKMPGLDGIQTTEIIKNSFPDKVVIMLTSYTYADEKERSFHAGCDDYLNKPVREKELLRVLSRFF